MRKTSKFCTVLWLTHLLCGCGGDTRVTPPQVIRTASPLHSGERVAAPSATPVSDVPPPAKPAPKPAALPVRPAVEPPPVLDEHLFFVREGETMGLYVRWSQVPLDSLMRMNGMSRVRGLRYGQKFRISLTAERWRDFERLREAHRKTREDEFFRTHHIEKLMTYVVKSGDSLASISTRFSKVPRWLMARVNERGDIRSLHPGDRIFLPIVVEGPPVMREEALARAAALERGGPLWQTLGERDRPRYDDLPPARLEIPRVPLAGVGRAGRPAPAARTHRASAWAPAPVAPAPSAQRSREDDGNWFSGRVREKSGEGERWFGDSPAAAAATPDPAAIDTVTVKVRRGESLARLGQWSGTSREAIAAANGLAANAWLTPGQPVLVPMPESRKRAFFDQRRAFHNRGSANAGSQEPGDGAWFPYEVRPGDSAWKIAHRRYGIKVRDLRRFNPGVNLDRLQVGYRLRIPTYAVTR